ncbi:MAG: RidA family protein [Ruminococcaceae bacterium]|jgi:enamine deaminase RidA (YjgF/YER057c/UK114 family)|nr:RidA family protein [Oscillospiraceae bacterium]
MSEKKIEKIYTPLVAKPNHNVSQAVRYGDLLFVAGQVGETADEKLVEGGMEAQVEQAILNLKSVLEAAGSSLDKVLACQCFIANMEDIKVMNKVYDKYFSDMPVGPARYSLVASPVAKGYLFEISAFAAV